ncbi:DUF4012 domain-containing protein [Candidatus Daviesbacteria bacterium]|nr:DUF4012 domain-containing protein [Candidatus Daviesbacteria bacterium]
MKHQRKRGNSAFLRRILISIVVILLFSIIPSFFVYTGFRDTITHGKAVVASYSAQNYDSLKSEVSATKVGLQRANFALNFLFWLKIIPFLGGYYSDIKGFSSAGVEELKALEKIIKIFEPEKIDLGFNGQPKGGPERMTQIIKILDRVQPYYGDIQKNLEMAAASVKNINTDKYPLKLKGKEIRKNLLLAKNFIVGAEIGITKGKDAVILAPNALGLQSPKTYLLLFQNDKEIRPTGGFITAYATLTLTNGQVSSSTSDDIYRLDEKLLATCLSKICPLTPPAPITKYLPEVTGKTRSAWSMRDSNISPDLPTSAKEFERMYELLGQGLPFDGIIYIDSQVVEELIEITGPIDVYDTKYSAEEDKRCSCPNVIYELESYAEIAAKGEQDRKAILGVLMQQILARTTGADIEKIPQFVETIVRLANHKHIMFFAHDQKLQQALSNLNWTGEIRGASVTKNYDGDYLHINDSNFAGGKSNLYVEQTVTQEIMTQKDGIVKKKITVEYKNPQPFGVWLNGINRDYVRFYVPLGSKLISSKGSEDEVVSSEDLGKTVFEAFIQVRPQNSRKLEMEYTVPYQPKGEYKLLIQKQPGAKDFEYKIKLNGRQVEDFKLDMDKEFKFPL